MREHHKSRHRCRYDRHGADGQEEKQGVLLRLPGREPDVEDDVAKVEQDPRSVDGDEGQRAGERHGGVQHPRHAVEQNEEIRVHRLVSHGPFLPDWHHKSVPARAR